MSLDINYYDDGMCRIMCVDVENKSWDIPMDDFWNWVQENELNSYCDDSYDPSQYDGHKQVVGKMTREEYFDHPLNLVEEDVKAYLKEHFNYSIK